MNELIRNTMNEKVALVTGANKGIGFGIAKHLGLSGWKVIVGARNKERARDAIRYLKTSGVDVLGWVNIELKDIAGIEQAAMEVSGKYPNLSLLVNNAGIPGDMSVNSRHTDLSDISEISPYWHPLAYVASKAAQNAMMGVMAVEFQQSNTPVEIFSVHPGPTTTDLNGNMSLPGFHNIDTVGSKFSELINDGQSHQGEFIELYPIVKED